ncbi:MAG: FAD-dependent thymidylate synthase [Candidatus Kaelpia aquatica]|nr:FAD-dependent thymidylate synthase [Candidatus Kaelpia aquatica]
MAESKLKVKLLAQTPAALKVIYSAARQCYSSNATGDIFDDVEDNEKIENFIEKILVSGHESPLEHASFTFAIEGISRVCSHQLVRHRMASFSQQSQRYVRERDFDYIVPDSIKSNPEIKKIFEDLLFGIQSSYNKMLDLLKKEGLSGEEANQDVRFVLPGACETKIVISMNLRELIHFFKLRLCTRAQWEIRALAQEMLKICQDNLPALFKDVDARCASLGYCSEGEKFSCGRYLTKDSILTILNQKGG